MVSFANTWAFVSFFTCLVKASIHKLNPLGPIWLCCESMHNIHLPSSCSWQGNCHVARYPNQSSPAAILWPFAHGRGQWWLEQIAGRRRTSGLFQSVRKMLHRKKTWNDFLKECWFVKGPPFRRWFFFLKRNGQWVVWGTSIVPRCKGDVVDTRWRQCVAFCTWWRLVKHIAPDKDTNDYTSSTVLRVVEYWVKFHWKNNQDSGAKFLTGWAKKLGHWQLTDSGGQRVFSTCRGEAYRLHFFSLTWSFCNWALMKILNSLMWAAVEKSIHVVK